MVPRNDPKPNVCIIGAGASGLAAAKALQDRGVPFDCFEKSDRVGGLWAFGSGASTAYRSLRINTSRDFSAYRDFPMPRDYPDYPHHGEMARYFEAYADAFGLHKRIAFNTEVTRAERLDGEGWRVTLGTGKTRRYDALVVANGHHWDPRWPDPLPPGRFDGTALHAHDYRDPTTPHDLRGRRVVVVGMGNSAMDIASELSRPGHAGRVFLSARRGAWILPKYILGRPLDRLPRPHPLMPWWFQSLMTRAVIGLTVGVPWRQGLPKPDHPPLAAHPTMSQDLLAHVRRGEVVPKPGIAAFEGDRVRFADGSVEEIDAVVWCTGYNVTFPFLDPGFLSAPDNDLPLWRRMIRPGDTDLFFVGLAQPLGATTRLAEAQAKFIADYLAGDYLPPPAARMRAEVEAERRRMFRRYTHSPRHTMQVDFERYVYELEREKRAGRRRARAAGNLPPVQPRAGARTERTPPPCGGSSEGV